MTRLATRGRNAASRRPHPFDDDQLPDHTGATRCRRCALPRWNDIHLTPDVDEQVEHRRRVGEVE